MPRPGRPRRLDGVDYDTPGPVFHCRLGVLDRKPLLAEPETARLIVEALKFHHGRKAEVLAYCVMPDHFHVLVAFRVEGVALSRWVGDFKRWVGRRARLELGVQLEWQPSFFEHVVRKDEDLLVIARYILANPVRAGLVQDWKTYPWSGSLAWRL
jgi:putative transposase